MDPKQRPSLTDSKSKRSRKRPMHSFVASTPAFSINAKEFQPVCNFICDTYARANDYHSSTTVLLVLKDFSEKTRKTMQMLCVQQDDRKLESMVGELKQSASRAFEVSKKSRSINQILLNQVRLAHNKIHDLLQVSPNPIVIA